MDLIQSDMALVLRWLTGTRVRLNTVLIILSALVGLGDCRWMDGVDVQRQGVAVVYGPCKAVFRGTCPDPNIQFYLYTRLNPEEGQIVDVEEPGNLTQSNFNVSNPNKIIIHGYNSGMLLSYLVDIRREYLMKGQYNVFTLNWEAYSNGPWMCYPMAVMNTVLVGKCGSHLVTRLRQLGATDIHVVGFSLGAHVAGAIANDLRPYKLPRITGLDPAMPLFVTLDKTRKLDKDDAMFVDVLHTNGLVQGKLEPSGDVDFYMNGGVNQPGCWQEINPFACGHHRAPAYFAESITTQAGFWGWRCNGFIHYLLGLCNQQGPAFLMGEHVDESTRGLFIVNTSPSPPFALGRWDTDNGGQQASSRYSQHDNMTEGCLLISKIIEYITE